jgi:hypothetical protein
MVGNLLPLHGMPALAVAVNQQEEAALSKIGILGVE